MHSMTLRTDDFDYTLPEHLVAQKPAEPRDSCRLLVMPRHRMSCTHAYFRDLPSFLRSGDRLVFNDTRVMPARIFVRKSTGGRCEILFLEKVDDRHWKALAKPGSNARKGTLLYLDGQLPIRLRISEVLPSGERIVSIADEHSTLSIEEVMECYGHVPLPPYIEREDQVADRLDYQTVYASVPGAVAAPTAGLHFTAPLLTRLREQGIDSTFITLHVGIGTFRPVKAEYPLNHEMHEERFHLSEKAVQQIEQTRAQGGRIIAVGTTVVRVLEHCHASAGRLFAHEGSTKMMILPPYEFGIIDGLITNFHLPRSTLLMLVSAFGGRHEVMHAYHEAVAQSYRFFSYGDAMFIL